MEITFRERQQLREIIVALTCGDQRWFTEQAITVSQEDRFWVLNYLQKPRTAHNQLVRGMVVERPQANGPTDQLDLIRSFPFTRFFNYGEPDAAAVEFGRSEMIEKLDGIMVGVFFPTGKLDDPHWHTRRMVASNSGGRNQERLLTRVGDYIRKLTFTSQQIEYTWVFEFVDSVSFVRTRYRPQDYGLYLLGARHLVTHRELDEDRLDDLAGRMGARRPRRWGAVACPDEIQRILQAAAREIPDFEGFVFRDQETGARIKMKDPNYVQALQIAGQISWRTLIPKVVEGEEDEIIAYFPAAKEKVLCIKQRYQEYLDRFAAQAERWLAEAVDQKTLAKRLFAADNDIDPFLRSQIMKLRAAGEAGDVRGHLEAAFRQLALGQNGAPGNPGRLAEILRLNDDP